MTETMKMVCANMHQLSDADLVVLTDEAVAERSKRGLLPKTHEPGYFNRLMKQARDSAKKRNGKNWDLIGYRKRNKFTQQELADRLGIHVARVSDYELGVRKTPEWIMDRIRKEESDGPL